MIDFIKLWQEALPETTEYADRDAYISDWALSTEWGDDESAPIPNDRLEYLGQIWDAAHRSSKDIAQSAGLSQRKLAERFGIPSRTMEAWGMGERTPPTYVRLMMQECLGLLKR